MSKTRNIALFAAAAWLTVGLAAVASAQENGQAAAANRAMLRVLDTELPHFLNHIPGT